MDADTHASYARNGKVMLASAILLFLIVLIIIFFHTYGHWCCRCHGRRRRHRYLSSNRMHSLSIATHDNTFPCNKGLEPSILKSLPTFVYCSAAQHPLMECAVCLSEFEDDDEGRLLPYCNHAFHSHCIDIWFRSHSNCPLCRAPVRKPDNPIQLHKSKTFQPVSSAIESPVPQLGRMEEGGSGSSSILAPIACPRKPLELVSIAVELPAEKMRGTDSVVPGQIGSKSSDFRIFHGGAQLL